MSDQAETATAPEAPAAGAGTETIEMPPGAETPEVDQETPETEEPAEETEAEEAPAAGEEAGEEGEAAEEKPAAEGEEGAEAKKKPEEKPPAEAKVKFTVGENEYEMTPTEMVKVIQGAEAQTIEANDAIEYANKVVESANKFIGDLREDWRGPVMRILLSKHKNDEKAAWGDLIGGAKEIIKEALEYERMSPAERDALAARRDAQKYKTELDQLQAERKAREEKDKEADGREKILKAARPALQAAGLPQTEEALKLLVDTYRYNRSMGKKVTLEGCAKFLRAESAKRIEDLARLAEVNPDEFLDKFPAQVKRLNEAMLRRVKRVRSGVASGTPGNGAAAAPGKATAPDEPIVIPSGLSTAEFYRELDSRLPKGKRKKP